jgi:iron complex outermembrane receptor protein
MFCLTELAFLNVDIVVVCTEYSTSFVSGGSVAGLDFAPETARSFELGVKTDLWDRKLRTNLALFHVIYDHYQLPSTTTNPGSVAANLVKLNQLYGASIAANLISSLSTFVNDVGKLRAQGVELEVTAAPTRGVTIGGNLGYTDTKLLFVPPTVLAGYGGTFRLTQRPKWTANLYGVYETEPLFGNARLQFRADGLYQSATLWSNSPASIYPANAAYESTPGYWLVNGRAALRHVDVGGANLEIAGWVKNLTNRRDRASVLFTPLATAATFIQARSYGLDVAIEF